MCALGESWYIVCFLIQYEFWSDSMSLNEICWLCLAVALKKQQTFNFIWWILQVYCIFMQVMLLLEYIKIVCYTCDRLAAARYSM